MDYSFVKGLIKNIKLVGLLSISFCGFVYFVNPELLAQLFENLVGTAGAGTAMIVTGLILNYIKQEYPNLLPRIAE